MLLYIRARKSPAGACSFTYEHSSCTQAFLHTNTSISIRVCSTYDHLSLHASLAATRVST
ncbi:hypothetical protein HanXRQr2_Chr12g0545641 [Helianthus annuus]|uniref:Uncharacterized protein n=1 Tax=Helianthus annuus TaxID=4232 RepID=A0A251T4F3_HELAN|nr:hypothetical protein HanXRQr2_Chr12g0545641 [Helianthus annuus]